MQTFALYVIGYVLFVVGLAWGAQLLGAPPVWIGVGVLVLVGIGVMSAVKRTQAKAPQPRPDAENRSGQP